MSDDEAAVDTAREGQEADWHMHNTGTRDVACDDCGRPYGAEHGFPDLIIPNEVWRHISPKEDGAGLLCPSCICARLHAIGARCQAAFASGPIESVTYPTMWTMRMVENMLERETDG